MLKPRKILQRLVILDRYSLHVRQRSKPIQIGQARIGHPLPGYSQQTVDLLQRRRLNIGLALHLYGKVSRYFPEGKAKRRRRRLIHPTAGNVPDGAEPAQRNIR